MKLPEELSASSGVGVTRVAMMGDQSQCKARGRIFLLNGFVLGSHSKGGTFDFMALPGSRIAVRLVIAKTRIANTGELVG